MDDDIKKKNVLDLQFQKYLTMASVSIIIMFTYFIGVGIAIFTEQIKLNSFESMFILFIISAGVLGSCSILFFNSLFHLRNIPQIVLEL